MKYKCLIAENNVVERDLLEMLLRKIEQVELIAVCNDGLEALQVLMHQDADIVFTDIDMPELSGIGLLKSLKKVPVFVFISAYSQYAADGFDLDVADFIVKPVLPERLIRAFNKAREHLERNKDKTSVTGTATDHPGFVFVRTSEGLQKIVLQEINYIESLANFSRVHTVDGRQLMVLINLKNLENQLPPESFIRIHKQYLINWQHILVYSTDRVTLAGQLELPVGETYRPLLSGKISAHKVLERKPGK